MSGWDGKSKGKVLGYRIFVFFMKVFGVSFAYFILRFVALYYYLFQKQARTVLLDFYQKQLSFNLQKAKRMTRKNFYIFGQILIDRMAFLAGQDARYTYSFENEELIDQTLDEGNGIILISAHLGNWETAGNLLKKRLNRPINVVMYDEEAQKIKQFIDGNTKIQKFNVIPVKNDISHVIAIHAALRNNEIIALHGDRFMDENNTFEIPFLNGVAKFPQGPFTVAERFGAPYTFVYAVKTGKYHYHFSATPVGLGEDQETVAKKYVKKLEQMVNKYPEQWFNYFKFHNS